MVPFGPLNGFFGHPLPLSDAVLAGIASQFTVEQCCLCRKVMRRTFRSLQGLRVMPLLVEGTGLFDQEVDFYRFLSQYKPAIDSAHLGRDQFCPFLDVGQLTLSGASQHFLLFCETSDRSLSLYL